MALKNKKTNSWMTDGLNFEQKQTTSETPVSIDAEIEATVKEETTTPPESIQARPQLIYENAAEQTNEISNPDVTKTSEIPIYSEPVNTNPGANDPASAPTAEAVPVPSSTVIYPDESAIEPMHAAPAIPSTAPVTPSPMPRKGGPVPYAERRKLVEEFLSSNPAPDAAYGVMTPMQNVVINSGAIQSFSQSWMREPRSSRLSCSITPSLRDKLDREVMYLNIKSMNDLINFLLEQYFEEKEKLIAARQKQMEN